jgi:hypothetical protein
MSEYQYYEFQAIDRPLSQREMQTLRGFSTRATITRTRFVNQYEWGDFKGNPVGWMEKYFDAFVYVANWGTRELMLRLPRRSLDLARARPYLVDHTTSAHTKGAYIILKLRSDRHDGDDWDDDGRGWLAALIPIRAELASGDPRALYLAWLSSLLEYLDDDALEPPVPPGLGRLTASQQALADFLRVGDDLIAVAAERSSARVDLPPRTAGELRASAQRRTEERRRRAQLRAARERARRDQQEAAAREKRLQKLAKNEPATWERVGALIAAKQPAEYDEAVRLLTDLCLRDGRSAEIEQRIRRLRDENMTRQALIRRMRDAGLLADLRRRPRSGYGAGASKP